MVTLRIHRSSRWRVRLAVYADVGDPATGSHQSGGQLERLGDADGFDRDVRTEAAGERRTVCFVVAAVSWSGRRRSVCSLQSAVRLVDGDDARRGEELRGEDGGQTDRADADDGDDITRAAPGR